MTDGAGQGSAPSDDFSRKEKHPLGQFYELLCSYQAPGCVEQSIHTTSILGIISLTDRFNLFHCHLALQDKPIYYTKFPVPKQTQVSHI